MKKINLISILMVFAATFFVACEEESSSASRVKFYANELTVSEDEGTLRLGVILDHPASKDVQIDYDIVGGTAVEGVDYTVEETSLMIAAGETNGAVVINLIDDFLGEGDLTLDFKLTSAEGLALSEDVYKVTIADNECEYTIDTWVGDYGATEIHTAANGGPWGPYPVTLVQDEEDPNKFWFDNFFDSGVLVYLVFDLEHGTVTFPDQVDTQARPIVADDAFYDTCEKKFTIHTTYRGFTWDYEFVKTDE